MFYKQLFHLIPLFLVFPVFAQQDLVSMADSAGLPTRFNGFKLGMSMVEVKAVLFKKSAKVIISTDAQILKANLAYHELSSTFELMFPTTDKLSVISCMFANGAKSQFDKVASLIETETGASIGDRVEKVNESLGGQNMPEVIKERKWGTVSMTEELDGVQTVLSLPIVVTRLYWSHYDGKSILEYDIRMD